MLTIGVHGFQHDLGSAEREVWPVWRKIVEPVGRFIGFGWYSYPAGPAHVIRAWQEGHWNRYYAAWHRAAGTASERLRREIAAAGETVNLLAHSLGSRVVLAALARDPKLPVRNVVFLSGADSTSHACSVAEHLTDISFTNVVVPGDDVLGVMGRLFTPTLGFEEVIGRQPIGGRVGPHWRDVVFTGEKDDDHWDAYRREEHWPLIREALSR